MEEPVGQVAQRPAYEAVGGAWDDGGEGLQDEARRVVEDLVDVRLQLALLREHAELRAAQPNPQPAHPRLEERAQQAGGLLQVGRREAAERGAVDREEQQHGRGGLVHVEHHAEALGERWRVERRQGRGHGEVEVDGHRGTVEHEARGERAGRGGIIRGHRAAGAVGAVGAGHGLEQLQRGEAVEAGDVDATEDHAEVGQASEGQGRQQGQCVPRQHEVARAAREEAHQPVHTARAHDRVHQEVEQLERTARAPVDGLCGRGRLGQRCGGVEVGSHPVVEGVERAGEVARDEAVQQPEDRRGQLRLERALYHPLERVGDLHEHAAVQLELDLADDHARVRDLLGGDGQVVAVELELHARLERGRAEQHRRRAAATDDAVLEAEATDRAVEAEVLHAEAEGGRRRPGGRYARAQLAQQHAAAPRLLEVNVEAVDLEVHVGDVEAQVAEPRAQAADFRARFGEGAIEPQRGRREQRGEEEHHANPPEAEPPRPQSLCGACFQDLGSWGGNPSAHA